MAKFSRRSFLKTTAAAAVSGKMLSLKPAEAAVTEVDFGLEKKVPMLCRMCAQQCPMFGVVRDGRMIRVEANRSTPYGGICGRGRAAMGALYDPDRIKSPLIRVGERGEGKFRKASWDEALDLVVEKLKAIKAEGEERSVAFLPRFNSAPMIDKEFFNIYGTPNVVGYGDTCFGNALPVSLGALTGGKKVKGVPGQGTGAVSSDYENAEYGVCMQRNPGGGLVTHSWGVMFGRGKKNGLKLTIVDPRKPSEAGESDADWLPIRPGTDAAFLLGLMHEIFEKKYYDEAYVRKHTNADMLVDTATGLPVKTREAGKVLDYLVAEKDGRTLFGSETKEPALFGRFEVNVDGEVRQCATAFQLMLEEVQQYSPEWAEKVADIPAEKIRSVAGRLNQHKPKVFIDRGYRSERYASSFREKLLINQINVLLGAFGVEGGVFWNRGLKTGKLLKAPKPAEKPISSYYMKTDPSFKMLNAKHYRRLWAQSILEEKPYRSRMAVFAGQNIVGGSSGGHRIVEALKKLEMVVAISPFYNETMMYADVVLPDATFMERDEPLRTKFKAPVPTLAVNRKAVEPLFDTKDGYWIILQIAKRVLSPEEYGKYFAEFEAKGLPLIWKKQYATLKKVSPEELASIPPLERVLEGRVWTGKKKYKIKAKGSDSGRLELYSLYLAGVRRELEEAGYEKAEYASPLPVWNSPYWRQKKEKLGADEFIPITGFHPLGSFTGQQTKNNLLLARLAEEQNLGAVFVNRSKGAALGFADGDLVEIVNVDEPSLVTSSVIVLSELVHPDAMYSNYGIGAGHFAKSSAAMRNACSTGFNPNHVSNFEFSPLTGGQPSQDFIVKIRRTA